MVARIIIGELLTVLTLGDSIDPLIHEQVEQSRIRVPKCGRLLTWRNLRTREIRGALLGDDQ